MRMDFDSTKPTSFFHDFFGEKGVRVLIVTGPFGVGKTHEINDQLQCLREVSELIIIKVDGLGSYFNQRQPLSLFTEVLERIKATSNYKPSIFINMEDTLPDLLGLFRPFLSLLSIPITIAKNAITRRKIISESYRSKKEYIIDVLRRLGTDHKAIIWCDEVPSLDVESFQLLKELLYLKDLGNIDFIFSFNLEENYISNEFNKASVMSLQNEKNVSVIEMKPMNPKEIGSHLFNLGVRIIEPTMEHLCEITEGLPLKLKRVFNFLKHEGKDINEHNLNQVTSDCLNDFRFSRKMLSGLNEFQINLLEAAAVYRSSFDIGWLVYCLRLDEATIQFHLSKLVNQGYLISSPYGHNTDSPYVYEFADRMLLENILADIEPREKQKIFLNKANYLQCVHGNSPNLYSSLIAESFLEAKKKHDSVLHFLLAIEHALCMDELIRASLLLKRIDGIIPIYPDLIRDKKLRNHALVLVEYFFRIGSLKKGLKIIKKMLSLSKKNNDGLKIVQLLYWQSTYYAYKGEVLNSINSIQNAINIVLQRKYNVFDSKLLLAFLYLRKNQFYSRYNKSIVLEELNYAKATFKEKNISIAYSEALRLLGWFYANAMGDSQKALELGYRSLRIAQEKNFMWGEINSRRLISHCSIALHNFDESNKQSKKCLRQAISLGNPCAYHLALFSRAISLKNYYNNWVLSERIMQKSYNICKSEHFNPYPGFLPYWYRICVGIGNWESCKTILDKIQSSSNAASTTQICYFKSMYYLARLEEINSESYWKIENSDNRTERKISVIDFCRKLIANNKVDVTFIYSSKKFFESINDEYWSVLLDIIEGGVHLQVHNYEIARGIFTKNIEKTRTAPTHGVWPLKELNLILLGLSCYLEEDHDNALIHLKEAKSSLSSMGHYLSSCANIFLGKTYISVGKSSEGTKLISEAILHWKKTGIFNNYSILFFEDRYE